MAQHSFAHIAPYDLSSPEFLKRLQCEDALEGENARLSCQVIGDPGKLYNLALVPFKTKSDTKNVIFLFQNKKCRPYNGSLKTALRS